MKKMKGNMNEMLTDHHFVYRKKQPYSSTMRAFMTHLKDHDFAFSPHYVGEGDDQDILEHIEGEPMNLDDVDSFEAHKNLIGHLADVMHQFHEIGASFDWHAHDYFLSYPGNLPIETICHCDLAPYNIIADGLNLKAIIDFDTLCPGPRIWDLVYLTYRFIGLGEDCLAYQKSLTDAELKAARLVLVKHLCSQSKMGYPNDFFEILVQRLESLCSLFDAEIIKGNEAFIKMKAAGHYDFYQNEIAYILGYY